MIEIGISSVRSGISVARGFNPGIERTLSNPGRSNNAVKRTNDLLTGTETNQENRRFLKEK
jgi:hypothetical protein